MVKKVEKDQLPGAVDDARMVAAVELLGRTGADEFQVRYCDEEKPVIWIAAARWGEIWETGAAMTPLLAVFRLCDQVIDGGHCTHCNRPTGFTVDMEQMPLEPLICWYQFDPGAQKFVRGCDLVDGRQYAMMGNRSLGGEEWRQVQHGVVAAARRTSQLQ